MANKEHKRYMLYDDVEDYGPVGYYDSIDELINAYKEWKKETDGECCLSFLEWDNNFSDYVDICLIE